MPNRAAFYSDLIMHNMRGLEIFLEGGEGGSFFAKKGVIIQVVRYVYVVVVHTIISNYFMKNGLMLARQCWYCWQVSWVNILCLWYTYISETLIKINISYTLLKIPWLCFVKSSLEQWGKNSEEKKNIEIV